MDHDNCPYCDEALSGKTVEYAGQLLHTLCFNLLAEDLANTAVEEFSDEYMDYCLQKHYGYGSYHPREGASNKAGFSR